MPADTGVAVPPPPPLNWRSIIHGSSNNNSNSHGDQTPLPHSTETIATTATTATAATTTTTTVFELLRWTWRTNPRGFLVVLFSKAASRLSYITGLCLLLPAALASIILNQHGPLPSHHPPSHSRISSVNEHQRQSTPVFAIIAVCLWLQFGCCALATLLDWHGTKRAKQLSLQLVNALRSFVADNITSAAAQSAPHCSVDTALLGTVGADNVGEAAVALLDFVVKSTTTGLVFVLSTVVCIGLGTLFGILTPLAATIIIGTTVLVLATSAFTLIQILTVHLPKTGATMRQHREARLELLETDCVGNVSIGSRVFMRTNGWDVQLARRAAKVHDDEISATCEQFASISAALRSISAVVAVCGFVGMLFIASRLISSTLCTVHYATASAGIIMLLLTVAEPFEFIARKSVHLATSLDTVLQFVELSLLSSAEQSSDAEFGDQQAAGRLPRGTVFISTSDSQALHIRPGELVAIIGPTGCGKSALLDCISGTVPLQLGGRRLVSGAIAHLKQQPCIGQQYTDSTLRSVIAGGGNADPYYLQCLAACGLDNISGRTLRSLSHSHLVCADLARVAYTRSDIYLLDDPFAHMDDTTATHIFHQLLANPSSTSGYRNGGLLSKSTRILITRRGDILPLCTRIIVMDANGRIVEDRRQFRSSPLSERMRALVDTPDPMATIMAGPGIQKGRAHTDATLAAQFVNFERKSFEDLNAAQLDGQSNVHLDQQQQQQQQSPQLSEILSAMCSGSEQPISRFLAFTSRLFYAHFSHQPHQLACIMILLTVAGSALTLLWWIALSSAASNTLEWKWVIISALCFIVFGVCSSRATLYLHQQLSACLGSHLHHTIFASVLANQPTSLATSRLTPSGLLVYALGVDFDHLTGQLPWHLTSATIVLVTSLSAFVALCITSPACSCIVVALLGIYLALAGRHLSAPVANRLQQHQRELLNRVLQSSQLFDAVQHCHGSSRLHLLITSFASKLGQQHALIPVLPLPVIVFPLSVLALLFAYHSDIVTLGVHQLVAAIALIFYMILNLQHIQSDLLIAAKLCVAVDLIQQSSILFDDGSIDNFIITNGSNNSGSRRQSQSAVSTRMYADSSRIWFDKFYMRYTPSSLYCLQGLSAVIHTYERIGIVGPPSSGKSSLLLSLLGMCHPLKDCTKGMLLIDDYMVNSPSASPSASNLTSSSTASLSLGPNHRIGYIPQGGGPLFPGTVRDNLDPHGVFDNYSLLRVLDKTGLIKTLANRFKSTTAEPSALTLTKRRVSISDNTAGTHSNEATPLLTATATSTSTSAVSNDTSTVLDMPLFSADSHKCILSAGERFLLAVARLLLQRYSILAIDDGISLLDLDHAQLVFNVLRKEYAMTTLLIVSARIHDVLGCERIIVMDSGTIEEFDKPTTLVDKNGKFMRLIKASATSPSSPATNATATS